MNVFKSVLGKKKDVKCRDTKRQLFNIGCNYVIFHYVLDAFWCSFSSMTLPKQFNSQIRSSVPTLPVYNLAIFASRK